MNVAYNYMLYMLKGIDAEGVKHFLGIKSIIKNVERIKIVSIAYQTPNTKHRTLYHAAYQFKLRNRTYCIGSFKTSNSINIISHCTGVRASQQKPASIWKSV